MYQEQRLFSPSSSGINDAAGIQLCSDEGKPRHIMTTQEEYRAFSVKRAVKSESEGKEQDSRHKPNTDEEQASTLNRHNAKYSRKLHLDVPQTVQRPHIQFKLDPTPPSQSDRERRMPSAYSPWPERDKGQNTTRNELRPSRFREGEIFVDEKKFEKKSEEEPDTGCGCVIM